MEIKGKMEISEKKKEIMKPKKMNMLKISKI